MNNKINFVYKWNKFHHNGEEIYFEDGKTLCIDKDGNLANRLLVVLTGEKSREYGISIHIEGEEIPEYKSALEIEGNANFEVEVFKPSQLTQAVAFAKQCGTLRVFKYLRGKLILINDSKTINNSRSMTGSSKMDSLKMVQNLTPTKPFALIQGKSGFYPVSKETTEMIFNTHKSTSIDKKTNIWYLAHKQSGMNKFTQHIICIDWSDETSLDRFKNFLRRTVILDPSFSVDKRFDWIEIKNCFNYLGIL